MKTKVVIIMCFLNPLVYAMGDPHFIPANPVLHDMGNSTSALNQVAPDRGHQDQQKMEEKREPFQTLESGTNKKPTRQREKTEEPKTIKTPEKP